jgi:hypothetical protein
MVGAGRVAVDDVLGELVARLNLQKSTVSRLVTQLENCRQRLITGGRDRAGR